MELKLISSQQMTTFVRPFNRTSMELKLKFWIRDNLGSSAFNRTSMELKHRQHYRKWHIHAFNRTSMELKLTHMTVSLQSKLTFNRTSMELKRVSGNNQSAQVELLIEPVWN